MKKLLMVFALLVISFSNAQKGSILVLGGVGFVTGKSTETDNFDTSIFKQNSFSIIPKVGYQFSDKWTTGIQMGYRSSKRESFNSDQNTTNTSKDNGYYVGSFLRYTKKLSDLFSVYADLDTGLGRSKSKYISGQNSNDDSSSKTNSFEAAITPAIFINLKNNFGLNFGMGGIGFYDLKSKNDQTDSVTKESFFGFTFGQVFNVGISKNF